MKEDEIGTIGIEAVIAVHRELAPGLGIASRRTHGDHSGCGAPFRFDVRSRI
jgi:hypothetical protein